MEKRDKSYRIGDLAAMFGLTVRTVRYYEELGLLKSNDRGEGLHRRYPEKNLVYLKRVMQLKAYGLSLGEIKEFFVLAAKDRSGERCRRRLIDKYKERIEEEEKLMRETEARLKSLRWNIRQLETVGDFFECPGAQCPECDFSAWCEMKVDQPAGQKRGRAGSAKNRAAQGQKKDRPALPVGRRNT